MKWFWNKVAQYLLDLLQAELQNHKDDIIKSVVKEVGNLSNNVLGEVDKQLKKLDKP